MTFQFLKKKNKMKITKREVARVLSEGTMEDVGYEIHMLAAAGGASTKVPWTVAERETGFSRQDMKTYIDSHATDSELYYMKYDDKGLILDDPQSV
jgi:hypothetical protein